MSAEDECDLLHCVSKINGVEDNLVLVEPTSKEMAEEDEAITKIKTTKLPIQQDNINIGDEVY